MFKKILILCFSGNQGGMELDAVRMCRRVSEYADVTLICMSGSAIETLARQDLDAGFKYRLVTSELTRFFARALVDPRIVLTVRRAVKQHRPDLLIFFGTSEVKSIALALLGLHAKLVLRLGTTISRPKNGFFQRIAYDRVDGFLAFGEHMRRNIFQSFPAAKRPVDVCYPVVEFPSTELLPREPMSPINVLYHSRFLPGKGQLDAVIAFEQVCKQHEDLTMTLVGTPQDEDYVKEIKRFIESKNLVTKVKVLGATTDIASHLQRANIFLGPSYGEGFSNSFAEALASGLVCVTYDNTMFPLCAELGFDFLMAPTGDKIVLAEKLALAVNCVSSGAIDTDGNAALARKLFSAEAEKLALGDLFRQLT
jgi:glycosyltransferase involved in cell wall biosynthesis